MFEPTRTVYLIKDVEQFEIPSSLYASQSEHGKSDSVCSWFSPKMQRCIYQMKTKWRKDITFSVRKNDYFVRGFKGFKGFKC